MKPINFRFQAFFVRLVMGALCLSVQSLWATTHVVQFGGSHGFTYSPSTFSAQVGDTVQWEGDFSLHPLSSTSVPATALTWHAASGTSFIYAIKVAGAYNYRCDVHFTSGMIGSFTATESSVRYSVRLPGEGRADDVRLSIQDLSRTPFVSLTVSKARQVTVKVFDLSGREQSTVIDHVLMPGYYSIPLDRATMASGFYFIKLSSNGVNRVVSFFLAN
jgi:plastocyanin